MDLHDDLNDDVTIRAGYSKVDAARIFAIKRHLTQTSGNSDCTAHLKAVAELAKEVGLDDDQQAAAWLRHTCENVPTAFEELQQLFGIRVANLAGSITGSGQSRKAEQAKTIAKLTLNPEAIDVELCHRVANAEHARRDGNVVALNRYRSEMPAYRNLFATGHPILLTRLQMALEQPDAGISVDRKPKRSGEKNATPDSRKPSTPSGSRSGG
jgi:(p)ppGpp synthase/HD superfamily hydrolase